MAKTKLNDRLRAQVVARFAAWESPSSVQEWLKVEHGIEVGLSALTLYHFDNPLSRKQGTAKWVKLFDELRAAVVKDVAAIPIAHRRRRLQILNDLIEDMLAGRRTKVSPALVRELLEYAAKEAGGQFERERKEDPEDPRHPQDSAAEQARRIRDALFQMDASMNAAPDRGES